MRIKRKRMGEKEKKLGELKRIANEIKRCKKCKLWRTRKKAVPGEGSPNARLFFIGEAPGAVEDKTGRPFVGESGKLLTKILKANGIGREKVFITSCLKCKPPKNRKPKEDELRKCKSFLLKQISIIKPKIIVLLGYTAIKNLIGDKDKMRLKEMHGKLVKKEGKNYFITYHPAAGRRFPPIRKTIENDFSKLKLYLKNL